MLISLYVTCIYSYSNRRRNDKFETNQLVSENKEMKMFLNQKIINLQISFTHKIMVSPKSHVETRI